MNRTFTTLLVLALLAITSFTACKKSNEVLTINQDNLVGTYTIVSVKAKAAGSSTEQDVTSYNYPPCEMDDQIVLKSDLTATYVDAGTQCTPPGAGSAYWSVNGNILTIAGEDYTIVSLTRSTLVYQETTNVSGLIVTTTSTFRKY